MALIAASFFGLPAKAPLGPEMQAARLPWSTQWRAMAPVFGKHGGIHFALFEAHAGDRP